MAGGRLDLLDLARGVAAISVLVYHSRNFVGVQLLPAAYLAVDLFFVLSGFVIAHNYDRKIAQGMSLGQFMTQRMIRLYPCYVLAFALAFTLGAVRLSRAAGYVDSGGLALAGLFNLLMLPAWFRPYGVPETFPFNGASWSLFFELVANVAYCSLYRWLNGAVLLAVIAISAAALVIGTLHYGVIDGGMLTSNFVMGLPRVTFSFFAGVAIRRYLYGVLRPRPAAWIAAPAMFLLLLCFQFGAAGSLALVQQLSIVLALFPSLVVILSCACAGPAIGAVSRWAGNASYPVYILQTPLFLLFAAVPEVLFHTKAAAWVPYIGVVLILVTVGASLAVDHYFDTPVRRVFRRRAAYRAPLAGAIEGAQ